MAFKKNQTVTVEINDITDLGFGVGRVDGAVVFVSDTVPGDICEVKLIKVNTTYLVGRVEKYIVRSDKRVCTRCSERACKSCAYKNLSYEYEASLKEEGVRRLFSTSALEGIATAPVTVSPTETRYRNKAQYPIALVDGKHRVGFFAPKSHRVTPIADCPLTPKIFSDISDELLAFFDEKGISVYDEESGKGLLRHIYLRRGEVSEEVLVTVVINGREIPDEREMAKRISEKFPSVVGVLVNINREKTNVVLGDEYRTLAGRDYIYDTLSGVRLKITAPSFYQVNHGSAELLYAKAKELARPEKTDTLLDLFCGAGSIGLSMADSVGELVGIEIVDSAVECARENARASGIGNAHFFTGDATETERLLANTKCELGRKISPDVIILDPPRAGCDERLIRFVSTLDAKRIVYISCNPKTLARDVVLFRELGYDTSIVYPFDLFPCTGHVESVVCLTRSNKAT
jgi:23S rRNA (uracil1939-C5)-methyltransferase